MKSAPSTQPGRGFFSRIDLPSRPENESRQATCGMQPMAYGSNIYACQPDLAAVGLGKREGVALISLQAKGDSCYDGGRIHCMQLSGKIIESEVGVTA